MQKLPVCDGLDGLFIFVSRSAGDEVLSLTIQFEALVDLDDVVPNRLNVVVEGADFTRFSFAGVKFLFFETKKNSHLQNSEEP